MRSRPLAHHLFGGLLGRHLFDGLGDERDHPIDDGGAEDRDRDDAITLTAPPPDAGGVERARAYARRVDADLAIIDKRRSEDGTAEVMHVVGQVKGRVCIIADDIVDTAGTLTQSAAALRANGAAHVLACAVHGVLSGPALERIEQSPLEELIVTNTIPLKEARAQSDKLRVLSVAGLLGKAIQSIHDETSVSSLFV